MHLLAIDVYNAPKRYSCILHIFVLTFFYFNLDIFIHNIFSSAGRTYHSSVLQSLPLPSPASLTF